MNWHSLTAQSAAQTLKTGVNGGLSEQEAKIRLKKSGENRLNQQTKKSILKQFFAQFSDFCVIILLIACVISFATSLLEQSGDFIEPVVILIIVVLNAAIGVFQERRAEKAIDALKKLSAPNATVIRDKKTKKIPAAALVPGDIILLESGDMVPADARLIKATGLKIQESALTGESEPSSKNAETLFPADCSPADRKNMVYSSTTVIAGNCCALVTETGMNTQVGKIAHLLESEKSPPTPLQQRLEKIGKALAVGALVICAFVFAIGVFRQSGLLPSFMLAVSLAVAAIPEGLPAVVTIVLSLGVQRMAKSNAITRHLPAVETLGAATVICSDKTGTLTQNKMTVTKIANAMGEIPLDNKEAENILLLGSICNNARISRRGRKLAFEGDPTETSILSAAYSVHSDISDIAQKYPRKRETPFSSETKFMSTVNSFGGETKLIVKGAPDTVLDMCKYALIHENAVPISLNQRKRIEALNADMAESALRVLAVAYKKCDSDFSESELIFAGLIGMIDPPRPEAAKAVAVCKQAGITPVMITGDHVITARAIAKKLGIYEEGSRSITGKELDLLDDKQLSQAVRDCRVFARVTPEHKVRIVKAFQKNSHIVAMTGDGVNDAPALKAADIGCAMGKCGTDVAKNAADMILTDDNFATIVKAVEQGRGIYDNIKKAVHFLLGTNIGEILTVFIASLIGFEAPLVPIQLLWVNLVTDSLPAMALGMEKTESNIMKRKPISPENGFFSGGLWLDISIEGALIGVLTLLAFSIGNFMFGEHGGTVLGRTMAFCTLSFCEIAHAVNMRSSMPLCKTGFFSNRIMTGSVLICSALQAAVVVISPLAEIFGTVPLNSTQWLIVIALSSVTLLVGEAGKIIHHKGA